MYVAIARQFMGANSYRFADAAKSRARRSVAGLFVSAFTRGCRVSRVECLMQRDIGTGYGERIAVYLRI